MIVFDGNLTANKAIVGENAERTSRWSSKNIWESENPADHEHNAYHEHWLQISISNEVKINSVKIY